MDITPVIPKGKSLIRSYGGGGFSITGQTYSGSVLVFPDRVEAWPVTLPEDITETSLQPILAATGIEVLLVGTGAAQHFLAPALRLALKARNIAMDVMATGAACRTFNVLVSEDRRAAAALIAVC